MKSKNKKIILLLISIVVFIIAIFLAAILYINSNVNNYTYSEKNWITDNRDNKYDIYIQTDLPIFSLNGNGVFFDYINAFKQDTGLSFNISTTEEQNYKLINKNYIDKNDVVIYKDHYIILSLNNSLFTLSDLNNKVIGVVEEDKENISYYLTNYNEIKYKTYKNFNDIKIALENGDINYVAVPMLKYIHEIIKNEYDIVYHLDGLYSYYVLMLDTKHPELSDILTKFFNKWSNVSMTKLNTYFLDLYYNTNEYSELEKEKITNNDLLVGYISNLPFEGMIRNSFTGITNTYLSKFSDITGVTYKYIEYDNISELSKALTQKEIDLSLNYYSLANDNYDNTRILGSTDYVVLANIDNNIVINSLYSLSNNEIIMLSNMNLKYNMASKNLFEIKDYNNVKTMSKNISKDSIIIVEKEVYDYYKDSYFKKYSIRYMDQVKLNNSFLVNKENDSFNSLFDFFLSTQSANEIKNESVTEVIFKFKDNKLVMFMISNIFFIIVGVIGILIILYAFIKKTRVTKKLKKEDKLYYFDSMTNLKNRNFLNDNIGVWSSSKVYPQTIIIVDIKNLKQLNDRKGRESGDNQIKAVANALIKTQRDNSEIIRTDGDEFMIYLVGYDDKKISSYIRKLTKEFNETLPEKDYGVRIGYATIKSELTSVDDAIGEAISMIKKE